RVPAPHANQAGNDRLGPAPAPARHRRDERAAQGRLRPLLRPEPGPPPRPAAAVRDGVQGARGRAAADPVAGAAPRPAVGRGRVPRQPRAAGVRPADGPATGVTARAASPADPVLYLTHRVPYP